MSPAAAELAMLFHRDLSRLQQQVAAFPAGDLLWATRPGVSNSAGHLVLHLEGNLREFVGRLVGGVAFERNRPQEFAGPAVPQVELLERIQAVAALVVPIVSGLSAAQLEVSFPLDFLGRPLSTGATLIHIDGHLNWHLGQIDYLRRILTGSGAIALATL